MKRLGFIKTLLLAPTMLLFAKKTYGKQTCNLSLEQTTEEIRLKWKDFVNSIKHDYLDANSFHRVRYHTTGEYLANDAKMIIFGDLHNIK